MVYGYYYKTIKRLPLEEVCPDCGASRLQYLDVMCKVVHVFYIPFFPTNKMGVRKCDVCATTYHVNKTVAIDTILKQAKYPKYCFTGLILFLLLLLSIVALFIFGYYENKEIRSNLINEVQRGYTIVEKKEDGYKTSMFITEVRNDSVFVRENKKSTKGDVYQINEMENYNTEEKLYTKTQLQMMIDEGRIMDIVPTTLLFEMNKEDSILIN